MANHVLIYGPQASGKSTLARKLFTFFPYVKYGKQQRQCQEVLISQLIPKCDVLLIDEIPTLTDLKCIIAEIKENKNWPSTILVTQQPLTEADMHNFYFLNFQCINTKNINGLLY